MMQLTVIRHVSFRRVLNGVSVRCEMARGGRNVSDAQLFVDLVQIDDQSFAWIKRRLICGRVGRDRRAVCLCLGEIEYGLAGN